MRKLDLSRGLSSVGDTRAGECDDPHALRHRDSAHNGDWLFDAAGDGLLSSSLSCNVAGRDNSGSKCETPYRREDSDKRAGKRRWNRQSARTLV